VKLSLPFLRVNLEPSFSGRVYTGVPWSMYLESWLSTLPFILTQPLLAFLSTVGPQWKLEAISSVFPLLPSLPLVKDVNPWYLPLPVIKVIPAGVLLLPALFRIWPLLST